MKTILDLPTTLYQPAEAEDLAKILNDGDLSGWRYVAKHDPLGTGYSFIAVYDDEDIYVGKM